MTISDECLNSVLLQGSQGLDHLVWREQWEQWGRGHGGGGWHGQNINTIVRRFRGKNGAEISRSHAGLRVTEGKGKSLPDRLRFLSACL